MTIVTRTNGKKVEVEKVIAEQFLAADLDEVTKLQEEGKKVRFNRNLSIYLRYCSTYMSPVTKNVSDRLV